MSARRTQTALARQILGGLACQPQHAAAVAACIPAGWNPWAEPSHAALFALIGSVAAQPDTGVLAVAAAAQARGLPWTLDTLLALSSDEVSLVGRRRLCDAMAVLLDATRRDGLADAGVALASGVAVDPDAALTALHHAVRLYTAPTVRTRADDLADGIQLVLDAAHPPGGVPVPWASLASFTGILHPGWLVVCGARTSVGKTTLGVQFALDTARAGLGACVVSLEMTAPELWARVARASGVHAADPTHAQAVAAWMDGLPLTLLHGAGWSMAQIEAAVLRQHQDAPLALVVVDYGQLIRGRANTKLSRLEQFEEITADLKRLAQSLGVVVFALAQFHRASGEAEGARPTVASFRSSGSWEMDADQCWLLYRDPETVAPGRAVYLDGITPLVCDVGKNRHGATGRALLELHGPTFTVRDRV